MTNVSADEGASGWSRDGKWIYFSSDRSGEDELWRIGWGPEGALGEAVQVNRKGGGSGLESGDGRFVYYLKGGDPVNSLWRVPVSGGEEVQVLDKIWNNNFAIGDHGVYFIPETHATVQYLNFATGKVTMIATLAGDPAYGFSLAPDERSLLFTQYEEHGSDLMLVENFH